MAEKMKFELVSPERLLHSGEAESVTIPGMMGELGALPGHSPVLTTLRPGILTVVENGAETEYFVLGGFAEITPEGVTVLAEEATDRGDIDRPFVEKRIDEARKALEDIDAEDHHGHYTASQRINDLLHILDHIAA